MAMKTINLTELQAGEVQHKLTIVSDEPDLQDSYEVTEDEVQALIGALPRGAGTFAFDEKYTDMLVEELENCLDIAGANLERGDMSYLSYIGSVKNAIAKIKA